MDGGAEQSDQTDNFTAFLPKEIAGGKDFKSGEEIVLTVKSVDPDTGELEVAYAPPKDQEDTMSPMDKMDAMQGEGTMLKGNSYAD